jgi:hypothetical protein
VSQAAIEFSNHLCPSQVLRLGQWASNYWHPWGFGQPKKITSHKKKLIILHIRIDPKKKVRNSRRVRAHQSHENWNISLFRLE